MIGVELRLRHTSLAQMQRTVPVISQEGKTIDYGLGLHPMEAPGQGTFWGHGGTVWGAGALAMTRADGNRQTPIAVNLQSATDSTPRASRNPIPSTKRLRPSTRWRCTATPETPRWKSDDHHKVPFSPSRRVPQDGRIEMAVGTTTARLTTWRRRRLLAAMWIGLALTAIAAVYPFVDHATTHLLADHIRAGYPPYTRARVDSAVTTYLMLLSVIGALGVIAWLWTIRGRPGEQAVGPPRRDRDVPAVPERRADRAAHQGHLRRDRSAPRCHPGTRGAVRGRAAGIAVPATRTRLGPFKSGLSGDVAGHGLVAVACRRMRMGETASPALET